MADLLQSCTWRRRGGVHACNGGACAHVMWIDTSPYLISTAKKIRPASAPADVGHVYVPVYD
jgi:hypothetical protein